MILKPMAVLVTFAAICCNGCSGNPHAQRLLEDLFDKMNYNTLVRPVLEERQNVTVYLGLAMQEILSLQERSGRLSSRVTLRMWWRDYRLMWDPADYGGIKKIHLPASQVWTPDITLINGIEVKFDKDVKLTVYFDGDVVWMAPALVDTTCQHEFRSDSWHCPFRFRSWVHDGRQLDLRPYEDRKDIEMDKDNMGMQWIILSHEGHRQMDHYNCCRKPFPTMHFLLKLRVKIGHPAIIGKRSLRNIDEW